MALVEHYYSRRIPRRLRSDRTGDYSPLRESRIVIPNDTPAPDTPHTYNSVVAITDRLTQHTTLVPFHDPDRTTE